MNIQLINLDQIRTDGGTQLRLRLNTEVAGEYADLMRDDLWDWNRSPLIVVRDSEEHPNFWLVDGFHRLTAAKEAGLDKVPCEIRNGNLQEAIWIATSVNAQHGLRRSNEEKRRAVIAALSHPYAASLSDRKLAEHVGVSHAMVSMIKRQLEEEQKSEESATRRRRHPQPVAQGRGSPLKQIEKWWQKAPVEEKRALYEHLKVLYEREFHSA